MNFERIGHRIHDFMQSGWRPYNVVSRGVDERGLWIEMREPLGYRDDADQELALHIIVTWECLSRETGDPIEEEIQRALHRFHVTQEFYRQNPNDVQIVPCVERVLR